MCMGDQKFNDKINSMARLNSTRYASLTDSIISLLQNKGIYTDFHFIEKPTDILTKITGLSFKVCFFFFCKHIFVLKIFIYYTLISK